MKFDKARNLVKLLLAMCIVFCTAGIITNGSQAGADICSVFHHGVHSNFALLQVP